MRKGILLVVIGVLLVWGGKWAFTHIDFYREHRIGEAIDSLHHVLVYYNGPVSHTKGRTTTSDGYNVGLKYQCVEFVKRYYLEYLHHRMPDSYGNAVSFYSASVPDGGFNTSRGLVQFANRGSSCPAVSDLLVMDASVWNPYGHVAIVSHVGKGSVEIIQQNPGPGAPSRVSFKLIQSKGKNAGDTVWQIDNDRVLGWLRKE